MPIDPRLMQQMFQNPQGGGMQAPPPGQGGQGTGGAPMGPSFQGPDGAPGVQPMPYNGPMPDFTMPPADPMMNPGFDPLSDGPGADMAAGRPGWSPSARGGQSQARPMPYAPGSGQARPMPMPMPQGRPPFSGPGAQDRMSPPPAGPRGPDGMPRVPSRMGPNMDRMPPSGNPNGPNMDNMPSSMMDEEKRRALIQAILSRQFGG